MGLFRKKHRESETEDFILDFAPASESEDSKPQNEEFAEPEFNEEFELPAWGNRKKVTAPHAMTVNEILGTIDSEGENSPEGGIKPRQQIKAEELSEKAPQTEAGKELFSPPHEAQEKEDREVLSETAEASEIKEEISESAKALEAKEEAPEIKEGEALSDTQNLGAKTENKPKISIEEEANELIARLKSKKAQEAKSEDIPKSETALPEAEEVAAVIPEAKTIAEKAPEAEEVLLKEAENTAPKAEEPAVPAKKEATLSPTAQALYDRMMAQRAMRQMSGGEITGEAVEAELSDAARIKITKDVTESSTEVEPLDTDITPVYEDFSKASLEEEEHIVDSIFSSLKESLKEESLLMRKKQTDGESLVAKCKHYVSPSSDITEDSIDSIIHNAEQGARERLNNLYDIHATEQPQSSTSSFEFAALVKDNGSAKAVSVPVKLIDETSDKAVISSHTGEIKNFQFSFADNSEKTEESSATKIIDLKLGSTPNRADTAKIEAIRMHLDAMAHADITEEVPVPRVKFTGSDEMGVTDDIPREEAPQMDDYSSIEDKAGISTDLASKKVSLIARLLSTSVLFAASIVISFIFKDALTDASPMGYSIINLSLIAIAMAINHNTLKGIGSLLSGSPDMDSPCALAVGLTFVWSIVTMLGGAAPGAPALVPIAIMALIFNTLGKLTILSRISRGFDVIANSGPKCAVNFVEDKLDAAIMANGAVIGEALVAKGQETKNIRDYLKNSYTEDLYERKLKPILLATGIIALLFGVLGFVIEGSLSGALTSLCAAALLACPPTLLLCCNMPLSSAQKRLSEYSAMIAGHAATDAIASANAVAFSAAELFPEGTVKLYNMHVLNKGAVDKYLTAAAAVLGEAGSPLCPIFKEMLEDSKEPLPKADSIKYESQMGVSGWIGEHRVFVGNRTLMEGHNIKVPSLELDKKILRGGYFPVYLAFDQQLCALFIVGYEADETITYELRRLCSTGVTMLVQTNDPNITESMLCDYFGLYPDSIKILSPSGVSAYKKGTAFKESISAPASFSGGICGFLATVTSAINLKSAIKTLFVIQIVCAILGIAAGGYMIISGLISSLGIAILIYQLITTAFMALISSFKQP